MKGNSQGRGNSGVFIHGIYEVQVLDSYENITYADGQLGALYGQYPPLANPAKKPGEWSSYDVIFEGPRFDAEGKVTRKASVTVIVNGCTADIELFWVSYECQETVYRRLAPREAYRQSTNVGHVWRARLVADGVMGALVYDSGRLTVGDDIYVP